jgi:uncharacterized protein YggU (UPF0235/DUF167 family)
MPRVEVRAHPGAREDRVEALDDGSLGVWVCARAVDGQANAAIERCLAQALSLRPWQVAVVGGQRSRRKFVEIDLPSADDVGARLARKRA